MIINELNNLDHQIFQLVNSGLSNPAFDFLLPLFREKLFWMPLYLFLVSFVFLNFERRKSWLIVLGIAAAAGISDLTSSRLIKKNVQRIRPCNEEFFQEKVVQRVGCGSGYSFTSSHAANHFAVAVFLGGIFRWSRRIKIGLLVWAGLIAFSQVYVGVHFPGDVVFGALLGWLVGKIVGRGFAPAIQIK